jgi:sec-independent protein translocase protein TatC
MIWLKAGFVLGFVIASPGIFYSLWTFVAAGLYPHERRYVYVFLPLAVGLFVGGAALAFFVIFQYVIDFLLKFNDSMGINASPRLTDYMSFALFLPLGFGIAFQLPLVMLVLERLGIASIKLYLSQWRTAVLIIAFLSMILTPADPTSMIGMCLPLIGLYFFGIALCKWLPRIGSPHTGYDPK